MVSCCLSMWVKTDVLITAPPGCRCPAQPSPCPAPPTSCCPGASSRSQATVDDLKARFAELKPYFYPSRQRFTLPPREGARSGEALVSGKRLSDYALEDGSVVVFKDLGPQVGGTCAAGSVAGLGPVGRVRC